MTKELLYRLSLLTLFGFSILGILIIYNFQNISIQEALLGGEHWFLQLSYGLTYGFIAAFAALAIIRTQLLAPITSFYSSLFSSLNLTVEDVFFYSFCAGVGEEVFFRAALQPFFGIWLTALIFVAIHGYLDPRNWRMMLYGTLLVIITAGMGYLFQTVGLLAAASSHFAFDLAMFGYLIFYRKAE